MPIHCRPAAGAARGRPRSQFPQLKRMHTMLMALSIWKFRLAFRSWRLGFLPSAQGKLSLAALLLSLPAAISLLRSSAGAAIDPGLRLGALRLAVAWMGLAQVLFSFLLLVKQRGRDRALRAHPAAWRALAAYRIAFSCLLPVWGYLLLAGLAFNGAALAAQLEHPAWPLSAFAAAFALQGWLAAVPAAWLLQWMSARGRQPPKPVLQALLFAGLGSVALVAWCAPWLERASPLALRLASGPWFDWAHPLWMPLAIAQAAGESALGALRLLALPLALAVAGAVAARSRLAAGCPDWLWASDLPTPRQPPARAGFLHSLAQAAPALAEPGVARLSALFAFKDCFQPLLRTRLFIPSHACWAAVLALALLWMALGPARWGLLAFLSAACGALAALPALGCWHLEWGMQRGLRPLLPPRRLLALKASSAQLATLIQVIPYAFGLAAVAMIARSPSLAARVAWEGMAAGSCLALFAVALAQRPGAFANRDHSLRHMALYAMAAAALLWPVPLLVSVLRWTGLVLLSALLMAAGLGRAGKEEP